MYHNLEYASLVARIAFPTPYFQDRMEAGWRLWGEQDPYCQNFVEIWDWECKTGTELWIAHPDLIRAGEDIDFALDVLVPNDFAGVMGNLCSLGGLHDYLSYSIVHDIVIALQQLRHDRGEL